MNIGFVTRKAHPAAGGAEAHLRTLCKVLSEANQVCVLAQRIHDGPIEPVKDFTRRPPVFAAFRDGDFDVVPLEVPPAGRLIVELDDRVTRLGKRVRGDRRIGVGEHERFSAVVGRTIAGVLRGSDLLHVICGGNLASAAVHAGELLKIPTVVTPFAHPGDWDDDAASGAAYLSADAVIATLGADADVYRRLGVPQQRIHLAGVCGPELISGEATNLRQREKISGELVVFVGLRRPHKGVDLLLEAAPIVRRAFPDVTFAFVGPGAALDRSAEPWIRDVGPVDELTKAGWIEAADVVALPSAGESFGLVVTESWSLGTPVVTSDIAVLKELVTTADGGLAVPRSVEDLAAALSMVLGDPASAREMGSRGQAYWQKHYRSADVAARHQGLYEHVLSEQHRSGFDIPERSRPVA